MENEPNPTNEPKPVKQIRISLNRDTIINVVMVVELGLLVIFGWQIMGIKKSLADSGGGSKIVQAVQPGGGTAPSPSATSVPGGSVVAPDDQDHYKGSKSAKITLIEYSDFECPFCQRFHPTAQQAVDEYGGDVNWIYRHFPLSFHANAQKEAEAAECAGEQGGDDKFWEYTDLIFARTASNGTGFALADLGPLAEEVGLNESKFQDCLDSGKYAQHVQADMAAGSAAGVSGTPGTFVYNNQTGDSQLIPGALPFTQLKSAIDQFLNS